jgi:hypothetical protein
MENKSLGTLIDGIAASEALDTAGERLSIEGVDISSLPVSGQLNWEHKNDTPAQMVGKILVAKKIFTEADCESERMLYFWNKIKMPYIYIIGELYDSVGHDGAKQIASMLRYDSAARQAGRTGKNTISFSIEGSKLDTKGADIKRSIARKVTCTALPANHTAIAEEMPKDANMAKKSKQTNSLLKQEDISAEILEKSDYTGSAKQGSSGLWSMNGQHSALKPATTPTAPKPPAAQMQGKGQSLGQTKSGKSIFSGSHPKEYHGFTSQDHSDAMNTHYNAAMNTSDYKTKNAHLGMAKLHSAYRNKTEGSGFGKSADVAPSLKTGNVALTKEKIDGIYKTFEKKAELEKRIKAKHPTLNKHEVLALAKMVVYKKEEELEETLAKLKV